MFFNRSYTWARLVCDVLNLHIKSVLALRLDSALPSQVYICNLKESIVLTMVHITYIQVVLPRDSAISKSLYSKNEIKKMFLAVCHTRDSNLQ